MNIGSGYGTLVTVIVDRTLFSTVSSQDYLLVSGLFWAQRSFATFPGASKTASDSLNSSDRVFFCPSPTRAAATRFCCRRFFPGRWPPAACRSLRSSTPGAARRRACCRGCHSPPPCRSASPRSSQHLPFRWRHFSLVSNQNITWKEETVLRIRIRDPVLFRPLDQGAGMEKIQSYDPGWTSRILFLRT